MRETDIIAIMAAIIFSNGAGRDYDTAHSVALAKELLHYAQKEEPPGER